MGVHADSNNTHKRTVQARAHTRTRQCFPIFLLRLHFNLAGPMPSYFPKNCRAARGTELLGMMTAGWKAC